MQDEIQERDCWDDEDTDEDEGNDKELIDIDLTPEELTELRKHLEKLIQKMQITLDIPVYL